jgi:predicted transcriptional regulator
VSTQSSSSKSSAVTVDFAALKGKDRIPLLKERYGMQRSEFRKRPIKLKYKNAIVRQFKYDMTNKEIADELGIKPTTFSQYRNTDEGKALRAECERYRGNDRAIIENQMRDEAYHSYENILEARDRMYEANQLEAASKIDMKFLDALGFWDKARDLNLNFQGQEIRISLEGGTKEDFVSSPFNTMHLPEAEYELLESTTTEDKSAKE